MIWRYAMSDQRVIEVRSWGNARLHAPIKYSVAPHRPPSVLQINRESRREALSRYQLIHLGVSTWAQHIPTIVHVPWKYHIANPNSDPEYTISDRFNRGFNFDPPMPYEPQKIFVDFSRDTLYLGPDFNPLHLECFLTTGGVFQELSGLQYLALDRKLWLGSTSGSWVYLRQALYSLIRRPLKALYIVPDDERNALEDRYYYRKHRISLQQPDVEYMFWTNGREEPAKTVTELLEAWFSRLWKPSGREVPMVGWKSVRRDGRTMEDFRDGAWEVQKRMGDMTLWETWMPR